MRQPIADLDEFNRIEVLQVVWDTFADLARSPRAPHSSTNFILEGQDGVFDVAFRRCSEAGLIPGNVLRYEYPPFKHIVLKVFYAAINMGLILPSRLDQALDWSMHSGPFHFTTEGINYFSEGFISIDDPGYLGKALQELQQRLPTIEDGQIELLLEAQRCIKAGCYRAAMVVMGVANENSCLALLDAIPMNCNALATGSPLYQDWNSCCNTSLAFTGRWKPATRLLEEIKKVLRVPGRGEPWWQWWEMIPGALYTIGEAVRVARNAAAHNTERALSRAEVALLLAALPTHIEMIANITEFLNNPPSHLSPIQILGVTV